MALTEHCDVFGAVHEDGFNKIITHLMRQRPSLFNYGSAHFASDPQRRMCRAIEAHPEVLRRSNPLVTLEDPLPIPGSGGLYGVEFCVQLVNARIDFHPGNTIGLPPELDPLGEQRASLAASFCVGLGCPNAARAEAIGDELAEREPLPPGAPKPPVAPIPVEHVVCFCLEVAATARAARVVSGGKEHIALRLDGFEIVDIGPEGLESVLECYVATVLRVGILPKARLALDSLIFEISDLLTLTPALTPTSAEVPNNPAIEEDRIRVFVDLGIS